jgi:hypothetical protein
MAIGIETDSTLKTRIDNAASEIKVATENKDSVIGFKFINNDLAEAKILFEVIVKSLYQCKLELVNNCHKFLYISLPKLPIWVCSRILFSTKYLNLRLFLHLKT